MPLHGHPTLIPSRLRWAVLAPLAAAVLVACGGGGGSDSNGIAPGGGSSAGGSDQTASACPETGPYACKSGETEPLYTFQWALNYVSSWFNQPANLDKGAYGGGYDLNVEPVHKQGIKGQGVNVLVLDSGVDMLNEDLAPNADYSQSWNFGSQGHDPSPLLSGETNQDAIPHGTHVAGMIAAAQNGKGVMGIAPRITLGAAALRFDADVYGNNQTWLDAFGGADWSRRFDVINGSFGGVENLRSYTITLGEVAGVRGLKRMRQGKGAVLIKSAGNAFDSSAIFHCGPLYGMYNCLNPANDPMALEPTAVITSALNAKGQASSYSSAGSVVWITGMGGEYGEHGRYGESSGLREADIAAGLTGDGPVIFSTDLRGCTRGYSSSTAPTPFLRGETERNGVKDNPNCDYSYMNGTSSAAPTITGVVALMLTTNPDLTWRDVRDILRLSARQVDPGYEKRTRKDNTPNQLPYNALFDLTNNTFTSRSGDAAQLTAGATLIPVELGWQKNAVGNTYSNWYGFGMPDTAKAVALAQLYKKEPMRSKPAQQVIPSFQSTKPDNTPPGFTYGQISLVGTYEGRDEEVDAFQLLINFSHLCLGSMGVMVESPAGTKSLLKMPLDHFALKNISSFNSSGGYGLASYAFYGESAKGTWKIYAVASNPKLNPADWGGRSQSCDAAPAQGMVANNATLTVGARVIPQ